MTATAEESQTSKQGDERGLPARAVDMALRRVPLVRALGGADDLRATARLLQDERGRTGTWTLARQLTGSLPALAQLVWRLTRDGRVPKRVRITLAALALYVVVPIDPIPDFVPAIGTLDDALLAVVALRWVVRSVDPALLDELWDGDPTLLALLRELAS